MLQKPLEKHPVNWKKPWAGPSSCGPAGYRRRRGDRVGERYMHHANTLLAPDAELKLFWSTRETVVIITVRQLGVTKWGKGEGCLRSLMDWVQGVVRAGDVCSPCFEPPPQQMLLVVPDRTGNHLLVHRPHGGHHRLPIMASVLCNWVLFIDT